MLMLSKRGGVIFWEGVLVGALVIVDGGNGERVGGSSGSSLARVVVCSLGS